MSHGVTILRWVEREVLRIDALADADLIKEIQYVMNGTIYPWEKINGEIQKLGTGAQLYHEWTNLCNIQREWENTIGEPGYCRQAFDIVLARSNKHTRWNRAILTATLKSLRLIPVWAGLGAEGTVQFPFLLSECAALSIEDLWVDSEQWGEATDEEEPLLKRFRIVEKQRGFWKSLKEWLPM